ncbi:hypothetical protein GCM10009000_121100 [Halobacterium noricense]
MHIVNHIVLTINIELAGGEVVDWVTTFLSGVDTLVSDPLKGVVEMSLNRLDSAWAHVRAALIAQIRPLSSSPDHPLVAFSWPVPSLYSERICVVTSSLTLISSVAIVSTRFQNIDS